MPIYGFVFIFLKYLHFPRFIVDTSAIHISWKLPIILELDIYFSLTRHDKNCL